MKALWIAHIWNRLSSNSFGMAAFVMILQCCIWHCQFFEMAEYAHSALNYGYMRNSSGPFNNCIYLDSTVVRRLHVYY